MRLLVVKLSKHYIPIGKRYIPIDEQNLKG